MTAQMSTHIYGHLFRRTRFQKQVNLGYYITCLLSGEITGK